jgi:hypothetical protein
VTGLIRIRKISDIKISPKKKLHKLMRTVHIKKMRKSRKKKKHV